MLCLFNWLKDRGPRFRRKPFKLLAYSPTSRIGNRMEGRGEKEEEITIKRFRLSFHSGFVECWGPTTNRSRKFSPLISRNNSSQTVRGVEGRSMIRLSGSGEGLSREHVTISKFIPTSGDIENASRSRRSL